MKPAPGTEPVIMIIASLSDSARYEMLNPLFRRAFDFIREAAPAALETGRHVLEEDALTVMVNEAVMKKRENARMEVHVERARGAGKAFRTIQQGKGRAAL